jgi:hypothetical protein
MFPCDKKVVKNIFVREEAGYVADISYRKVFVQKPLLDFSMSLDFSMIVRGCFYRARGGFLQYSDSSLLI